LFLDGQLVARLDRPAAYMLAGRQPFASRARCERRGAHRVERVVGTAQLVTSVDSAPLSPQPFAVEQAGTVRSRFSSVEHDQRLCLVPPEAG
jgi:hypothetical protein